MTQKQRRLIRVASGVGLLVVAGGVAFLWLIGTTLLKRSSKAVVLPARFDGTEVSFTSGSDALLRGNLIRGHPGRGIVILMHGIRGNRADMAQHAEFLHRQGFSVLFFDFQAHGKSSGSMITSGYLESKDAWAAVNFARKTLPGEKIAVIGASLGGAAAVLAEPPLDVEAMVLEMVYPDIERATRNRIAMVVGRWAASASPLLTKQLKLRVGVDSSWFSPEEKIRHLNCPKLVIGGGSDQHTTLEDTRALFNAAAEPKELWIIENAVHENLYLVMGAEYEKKVVQFIEGAFKAKGNR